MKLTNPDKTSSQVEFMMKQFPNAKIKYMEAINGEITFIETVDTALINYLKTKGLIEE